MKTKELKDNKSMRTGVILAAIAIITLIALIITFAKYASQGTGEDSARVAKWGVNAIVDTDLELFDASYVNGSGAVTVDSSDHADVVAPGTTKTRDIKLATFTNGEAPEVMYHFEPTLKIENLGSGTDLLDKLDKNQAFTWILNGQHYQTVAEIQKAVADMGEPDIAPNHFPSMFGTSATPTLNLGWQWDFEYNGTDNDPVDTELGNLIALGNLSSLKTTLTINAYQCQGCSGPTPTYKSIQATVGTDTVTFLPAFADGNAPADFYKLDSNGYSKLDNSSMSNLATAISDAGGPANVYTDAENTTFYGTIARSWNTTFVSSTGVYATDLNSEFKTIIESANVKTVHGDYVNGVWVNDEKHNWNANDDAQSSETPPDLNGVDYSSFQRAYSSFLGSNSNLAYSSRLYQSSMAYGWIVYEDSCYWANGLYTNPPFGVVLSKTF